MSLWTTFRFRRTGRSPSVASRQWPSASSSAPPIGQPVRERPDMLAVVSCLLLVAALGLQLVLPYTEAPSGQGGLAPRRPRLVTVPPLPEYAAIQQVPLFAPDRHPGEASASGPGGGDLDGYAVL